MRRSLSALLLLFLLAGCNGRAPAAPPPSGYLAAETFLADIAQNIAGDRAQVQSLIPPGIDPHEFQPTPQDAIRLAQSRVLILNGLGYESWLSKSLPDAPAQQLVITATQGLTPADVGGAADPHMWMDPLNVVHYVEVIRDGLTQADPAGKDAYSANAERYISQLKELDAWARAQIEQVPPDRRLLVTNHDALGYFARAYGLRVIGAVIPSVSNESSPSAQQMAALIDAVRASRAPAIFLDTGENGALAAQIASATGARVVTDLYIETLSAPSGPAPTYLAMLRHDVTVISSALK